LGYEEGRGWAMLIVRAISFQDFQVPTYVITIHQRDNVTDRQTSCDLNTTL